MMTQRNSELEKNKRNTLFKKKQKDKTKHDY